MNKNYRFASEKRYIRLLENGNHLLIVQNDSQMGGNDVFNKLVKDLSLRSEATIIVLSSDYESDPVLEKMLNCSTQLARTSLNLNQFNILRFPNQDDYPTFYDLNVDFSIEKAKILKEIIEKINCDHRIYILINDLDFWNNIYFNELIIYLKNYSENIVLAACLAADDYIFWNQAQPSTPEKRFLNFFVNQLFICGHDTTLEDIIKNSFGDKSLCLKPKGRLYAILKEYREKPIYIDIDDRDVSKVLIDTYCPISRLKKMFKVISYRDIIKRKNKLWISIRYNRE